MRGESDMDGQDGQDGDGGDEVSGPVECARCTRTMKYKEWLGNDSSCIHCQFSEQNRTVECINCQVKMTLNRWLTNQGCIRCGTDLYR